MWPLAAVGLRFQCERMRSHHRHAEEHVCSHVQALQRNNYFSGRLLTDRDLRQEQEYHRELRRRHNRCLHGWGVVCGLELSIRHGEITVTPGLALDCQGDEIVSPVPTVLCPPSERPFKGALYVVIHSSEEMIEPVSQIDGATSYARVIEASRFALATQDPISGHVRRREHWEACGETHGVPLGRLRLVRGSWRLDGRYRRRWVK